MHWHCWFGHLACTNLPPNYLCVEWDVKPLHNYICGTSSSWSVFIMFIAVIQQRCPLYIPQWNLTLSCISSVMCSLRLMSYFFVTMWNSIYKTRIHTKFMICSVWMPALYSDLNFTKCFTKLTYSRHSVVLRSHWPVYTLLLVFGIFLCLYTCLVIVPF